MAAAGGGDQMINRSLAESLDALYAGRDSDSGIRDPELLQSCMNELNAQAEALNKLKPTTMNFLDIAWGLAVTLYGEEPYGAEDRLGFIDWLCEEAGFDR